MTSHKTNTVKLDIGGMTCTSCAMRVEKKLNKLEGVSASVNYATEKATVEARDDVDVQTLIETVAKTGYSANVRPKGGHPPTGPASSGHEMHSDHEGHGELHGAASMLRRLKVSALLTVPVVLLSMIPALQF